MKDSVVYHEAYVFRHEARCVDVDRCAVGRVACSCSSVVPHDHAHIQALALKRDAGFPDDDLLTEKTNIDHVSTVQQVVSKEKCMDQCLHEDADDPHDAPLAVVGNSIHSCLHCGEVAAAVLVDAEDRRGSCLGRREARWEMLTVGAVIDTTDIGQEVRGVADGR